MQRPDLTSVQRRLIGTVISGAVILAGVGFTGSYAAVRQLAEQKAFGTFALAFPIGIDAGIVVLLALDILLTWVRMPYPLLRQAAWVLTMATIAFNAAAAWPDPLGVGMHAVIPVLFIVIVEAARHAVGIGADIVADRRIEPVRLTRWLLSPIPTFKLWRRMKLWEVRSYDVALRLEQARIRYRGQLRTTHGRLWRWKAPVDELMPLRLARYGIPLADEPGATPAAATAAPRSATPAATATAPLPAAATPPAITAPPEPATAPAATATATAAVTATATAAVTATADAPPYEPGTPQHVVHSLWLDTGREPTGPDIVAALGGADLPNSPQQARKIRAQVRREHPELPGLRAA